MRLTRPLQGKQLVRATQHTLIMRFEKVCVPNPSDSTLSHRILPMMVSRLCLSLKKSADPRSMVEWRVDHFSRFEITNVSKLCFATQPVGKSAVETQAPC